MSISSGWGHRLLSAGVSKRGVRGRRQPTVPSNPEGGGQVRGSCEVRGWHAGRSEGQAWQQAERHEPKRPVPVGGRGQPWTPAKHRP